MSQQAKEILRKHYEIFYCNPETAPNVKDRTINYHMDGPHGDMITAAMSEYADLKCKPLVDALEAIRDARTVRINWVWIHKMITNALYQYREGEKTRAAGEGGGE